MDVSGDGLTVVGDAADASGGTRAFRWTAATGMQNLSSVYSGSIGSGSFLVYGNAISADAHHVVGWGYFRRTSRYEMYSTN
jgi:probable HAF family extracellular repeat protein